MVLRLERGNHVQDILVGPDTRSDVEKFVKETVKIEVLRKFDYYLFEGLHINTFRLYMDGIRKRINVPPKSTDNEEVYMKRNRNELERIIQYHIDEIMADSLLPINRVELAKNRFADAIPKVRDSGIESIFSNEEVELICTKLSTPFRRTLLKNAKENMETLHQISMNCYLKYGGSILSFLLSLPKASFGMLDQNVERLHNYENDHGEIPPLILSALKTGGVEFSLNFFRPRTIARKENLVATLFNRTTQKHVAFLTKEAYLEYRIRGDNDPLEILVSRFQESGMIYFGVNEGHCSYCDQLITIPTSCLHGYGPVCAENFGLPY